MKNYIDRLNNIVSSRKKDQWSQREVIGNHNHRIKREVMKIEWRYLTELMENHQTDQSMHYGKRKMERRGEETETENIFKQ